MNQNANSSNTMNDAVHRIAFFPDMSSHVETKDIEATQIHSSHVSTSQDKARFTLTVEQAAERFAQAGMPRSTRSIARWCQQNILEHTRVDTEKNFKFLIDPVSVERRITELQQAKAVTKVDGDISSHVEAKEEVAENVTSHVQTLKKPSHDMSRQEQTSSERETPTRLEVIHLDERERELLERMLADREEQIKELKLDKEEMREQVRLEREMRQRDQELHMEQVRLLAASDRDTKGVTKTIANLINNIWPGSKGAASGDQPLALTTVIHDVDDDLGGATKQ